ncbi:MAG: hypothetical protein QOI54_675 [Actinomycetota bacterium]|jgi:hypothetical protein|nr:hypothetical protein [Actinomycetota bacterium]
MVTFVLAHSPLVGPQSWGRLPDALRDAGEGTAVVVLDAADERAPYAAAYVASSARQIAEAAPQPPLVLVGHSGAGYLLPQLGSTQRAAHRRIGGYVFFDAGVPHARGATRLGMLRTEDADFAAELEALLDAGGVFPTWTEQDLADLILDEQVRHELIASLRPRGRDFFLEPVPFPGDWPDAPCGYVQLSSAYAGPARVARSRGWTVVEWPADAAGGHFAACADPTGVAELLLNLARDL